MSRNCLNRTIYKVVLTGGPCGGKTTGQERLSSFFENLGWKVFRVPEAATILLKGGVVFSELTGDQIFQFQEDLLLTMMRLEDVYVHLANSSGRDCLVICDRGTMDGSAYISDEGWNSIMNRNNFNMIDLRDNRYNQIVHMTTAALGAEEYYSLKNNVTRSETVEEAKQKDIRTREVWVGHPYFDKVDNTGCRNFEDKILRLIQVVCDRAGVEYGDRLAANSKKRKFLVKSIRNDFVFPTYQEFDVLHDYLYSEDPNVQSRIRKRGQNGVWHYSHTIRRNVGGQNVETRMQISKREYEALRAHKDARRFGSYKKRRSFMHGERYFQLDIYQPPLPPKSPDTESLMLLETYTLFTGPMSPEDKEQFPECLEVLKEVTGDSTYSMFNMCLREDATPGAIGTKKPNPLDLNQEQVTFQFNIPPDAPPSSLDNQELDTKVLPYTSTYISELYGNANSSHAVTFSIGEKKVGKQPDDSEKHDAQFSTGVLNSDNLQEPKTLSPDTATVSPGAVTNNASSLSQNGKDESKNSEPNIEENILSQFEMSPLKKRRVSSQSNYS